MKMIKTAYEHKQLKLKAEMKERMEKHRQMVAAQEQGKEKNIKRIKKDVFRRKSKAQISQEKKANK